MEDPSDHALVLGTPGTAKNTRGGRIGKSPTRSLYLSKEPAELTDHIDTFEVGRQCAKLLVTSAARACDVSAHSPLASLSKLLFGRSHWSSSVIAFSLGLGSGLLMMSTGSGGTARNMPQIERGFGSVVTSCSRAFFAPRRARW